MNFRNSALKAFLVLILLEDTVISANETKPRLERERGLAGSLTSMLTIRQPNATDTLPINGVAATTPLINPLMERAMPTKSAPSKPAPVKPSPVSPPIKASTVPGLPPKPKPIVPAPVNPPVKTKPTVPVPVAQPTNTKGSVPQAKPASSPIAKPAAVPVPALVAPPVASTVAVAAPVAPGGVVLPLRINCGFTTSDWTDPVNKVKWLRDQYFVKDGSLAITENFCGSNDALYCSYRLGMEINYNIPVLPFESKYKVTMHFIEPVTVTKNQRPLTITVANQTIVTKFDAFTQFGGKAKPGSVTFNSPKVTGFLYIHVVADADINKGIVNGIVVERG